ncbi:glycerol-3-phosphate 1-O-acyltransferase PlsY [Clostridium sp. AL.422]|uniref:glycerol-3-phosphate 1-O-acyltransferase PlsY n=1 Tax=Clostridium TaxID=1485 RepID=UPI00293DDB3F|nr:MULTISPECIES: glycerol-3-phosphate 1-O-acyltransferase PlsY [unclassified Clostridium]MDV4149941.1 glycerol-3-phosphate 1-O-acyltransferase PlsY [Clostridium sp. AL.422]
MKYIIVILIGYLIGSSSMSYYLGRLNNINVSKNGSGNLGASNMVAIIGWKAGIIVALHDVLKAYLAIMLARYLFADLPYLSEVVGVACVIGHIFPFYLKFKGGKGLASYMGLTIALDWKFAIALIVLCVILTLITDYVVSATFATIIAVPAYFGLFKNDLIAFCILAVASLVMIYKHVENIRRLRNGTEIGLRSANKGEHRVR